MINFHICSPGHECAKNDVQAINAANQSIGELYADGTTLLFEKTDTGYTHRLQINVIFA